MGISVLPGQEVVECEVQAVGGPPRLGHSRVTARRPGAGPGFVPCARPLGGDAPARRGGLPGWWGEHQPLLHAADVSAQNG